MTLKMNHLFGGIAGGVAFGLVSGLLLGSCVFEAGPNHRARGRGSRAAGIAADGPRRRPQAAPTPGGMDPGANVMATVFAKVGELKNAIEKNPQDRASLIELGNLYYDSGKYDQAAPLGPARPGDRPQGPQPPDRRRQRVFPPRGHRQGPAPFRGGPEGLPQPLAIAASLFFLAATTKNAPLAENALARVKSSTPPSRNCRRCKRSMRICTAAAAPEGKKGLHCGPIAFRAGFPILSSCDAERAHSTRDEPGRDRETA